MISAAARRCLFTVQNNQNRERPQTVLQEDLANLENWSNKWGIRFNAKDCHILDLIQKNAAS